MKIILASKSPQRKRLLKTMGYKFRIIKSEYEEKWDDTLSIEENVQMFAEKKAEIVFKNHQDSIVIGCDTFVVHPKNGVYLKPKTKEDAKKMLYSYSDSYIDVLSGISVISSRKKETRLVKTSIYFSRIKYEDVEFLLQREEWEHRSGGTSIEGSIMRFVKKIDGCFYNIIGLPTQVLEEMLSA